MSLPDFDILAARAREIVVEARKSGTLRNLTPKLVFVQLEEEYELKSKILSRSEHKEELREIIRAAAADKPKVEDVDDVEMNELKVREDEDQSPEPAPSKKRRTAVGSDEEFEEQEKRKPDAASGSESDVKVEKESPKPKKAPAKKRKVSVAEDAEESKPISKKPRSKPASKKATSARPESTRRSSKQFTSAEIVEDGSDDDTTAAPKSGSSTKVENAPQIMARPTTAKKPAVAKPASDDEDIEVVKKASDPKSDSELSVSEDEPPKKGRKGKSAKTTSKTSKEPKKRKGKAKEPLSKNEEKIERLKGYVRECGVRKVWAKEFKDLDQPSQRIARLEAILRELGMSGRFTVGRAKKIRKRRELASELQDVQAFEQKFTKKGGETAKPAIEDESEDEDVPASKRMTARARIAAFLADQSDSE